MLKQLRLHAPSTRITRLLAAVAVAGTALVTTIAEASVAHAGASGDCLVVDNETGSTQSISLTHPYRSGSWSIGPGERVVLSIDGSVVTSADGDWNVSSSPYYGGSWSYDSGANTGYGCNGSEILTWYS